MVVIWNREVAAKQVYYSDRDAAGTQGTVICLFFVAKIFSSNHKR